MPLEKSKSPAAVGRNIKEMEASGHPHDQAVAAALETQRRAGGGKSARQLFKKKGKPKA